MTDLGARLDRDLRTQLHLPVDPRYRATLEADGFVVLEDLWSPTMAQALAEEAAGGRVRATGPSEGPGRRVSETRPGDRPTLLTVGPVLVELHDALTTVARALTGEVLVPSVANYAYYEGDDEVQLHYDTDRCDLAMITEAMGPLGPLHVHPELAGATIDELFALEAQPSWDRESGIPVHHPRSGLTAMRGRVLAHHRPGRPLESLGAVASFFYRRRY